MTKNRETLERLVKFNIEYYKEELDKWSDRFKNDPVDALSRAAQVFTVSARLRVFREVELYLTKITVSEVVEILTERALSGARWPDNSTSQTQNLMGREMTSAYAEVAEKIKFAAED